MPEPVLVIACGALAREINELKKLNGWEHLHMQCIDARLHLRPALIPDRLRAKIRENKEHYERQRVHPSSVAVDPLGKLHLVFLG